MQSKHGTVFWLVIPTGIRSRLGKDPKASDPSRDSNSDHVVIDMTNARAVGPSASESQDSRTGIPQAQAPSQPGPRPTAIAWKYQSSLSVANPSRVLAARDHGLCAETPSQTEAHSDRQFEHGSESETVLVGT
jgi:hypothetical protein